MTLVVCGAAIWFLLFSEAFEVQALNVVGSQRIGSARVATMADVVGHSIFSINTDDLRRNVLQSSPYVKNATVAYRFPGQVVVKIDERTKSFTWKSGATTYDVADDGTVLGTTEGQDNNPSVIDTDNRPLVPGDRVDSKVLEMVQQLRTELPTKVGLQGQEFHRSEKDGVSVTTANGLQILFGTSEDWAAKLPVLQAVLEEGKNKGLSLQYIDLRLKNRPYFR